MHQENLQGLQQCGKALNHLMLPALADALAVRRLAQQLAISRMATTATMATTWPGKLHTDNPAPCCTNLILELPMDH